MTIYLDIVFLENFLLNFIIIYATGLLLKTKKKLFKFALSSMFGGLFSILEYVININSYLSILLEIIISIIMMLIAFGKKNVFKVFTSVLTFYFVSIAFGGMSFMILFSKNPEKIVFENNHFKGVYPFESLVLAGIMCFLLILFISFILRIKEYKKSELVEIEIINDGKCHKVKALFDTGNLLKEPITNQDVIIVEKSELYKVCDKDFLDSTNDILEGRWLGECFTKYKFCLIPFSSLGNENGLLIGFKPDYIKVILEEEYLKNEVFIGIYDGKLTNNNLYTSLIGLNILNKEECINEFV